MRLTHLELTDHRNIAHAVLDPDPHLTVLCGPNGQGKTNLLEAVWLLTGGKSFRGAKDAELIRRGCEFSVLEGAFETDGAEKTIRLTVGAKGSQRPGRTAKLNGWTRAGPPLWRAIFRRWCLSRTCWRWSKAGRKDGAGFLTRRCARCSGPIWWPCGGICGWWPRKTPS